MDEAAGRYADALQSRAATLPSPSPTSSSHRSFHLRLGDICQQPQGAHAHALACPCDARLLPSAEHPASHAIFKAAGPQLASTARLLFHRAEPGRAYPVKLPATSELRARQGVQYVILALPPPSEGNEQEWGPALRAAYEAVLDCFVREVAPKVNVTDAHKKKQAVAAVPVGAMCVAAAMAATATEAAAAAPAVPVYRHPGPPPLSAGWQGGLHQYLQLAATDAALQAFVFVETERFMVVRDTRKEASWGPCSFCRF